LSLFEEEIISYNCIGLTKTGFSRSFLVCDINVSEDPIYWKVFTPKGEMLMAVTGWIVVNDMYCKGCSLCVNACPQDVLQLDMSRLTPKGYHPAQMTEETCTGCGICAVVCPDAAITVYREKPERKTRR
jgi:2-oxoglutarate ferredoxin oxidoreductase subunit delta